jgi:hypothetical protein
MAAATPRTARPRRSPPVQPKSDLPHAPVSIICNSASSFSALALGSSSIFTNLTSCFLAAARSRGGYAGGGNQGNRRYATDRDTSSDSQQICAWPGEESSPPGDFGEGSEMLGTLVHFQVYPVTLGAQGTGKRIAQGDQNLCKE